MWEKKNIMENEYESVFGNWKMLLTFFKKFLLDFLTKNDGYLNEWWSLLFIDFISSLWLIWMHA